MKKLITIGTLALALTLTGGMLEARAGDDGWAAFGGFLGGTILANMTHGHHGGYSTVRETRVVVEPVRTYEYVERRVEYVDQRVWHDGYWSVSYDRCGRRVKTWQPGYYTVERVRSYTPRHRSRYGREYSSHRGRSHRSRCDY